MVGISYAVYADFQDITQNFESGKKAIYILNDNEILLGMEITQEGYKSLTKEDLAQLEKEDKNSLLKDNYKILIIYEEFMYNHLPKSFTLKDLSPAKITLNKQDVINIIKGGSIEEIVKQNTNLENTIISKTVEEQVNKEEIKLQIIALAVMNILENNPEAIISGFKDGTIEIYPETIIFKIVKSLPESFLTKIMYETTNIS